MGLLILAIIFIGTTGWVVLFILSEDIKCWFKSLMSLKTPSCSTCKHCELTGHYKKDFNCIFPAALECYEKVLCRKVESCNPKMVRGTKWCRYEKKEENDDVEE